MQQDPGGLGMGMENMVSGALFRPIQDISAVAEHEELHEIKAQIVGHPLYEQLLASHVGCLRVATPIDHLPLIDAQLSQSHQIHRSYQPHIQSQTLPPEDKHRLDEFMAQYLVSLCTFKEKLHQHVRVHAVEAVMACREIEQSLQALTGLLLPLPITPPYTSQILHI
ncbi:Homeobox protein knotted-1-like 3 [Asimina triloba]